MCRPLVSGSGGTNGEVSKVGAVDRLSTMVRHSRIQISGVDQKGKMNQTGDHWQTDQIDCDDFIHCPVTRLVIRPGIKAERSSAVVFSPSPVLIHGYIYMIIMKIINICINI